MHHETRYCPRCKRPMQRKLMRMTLLDQCETCALVYLDSLELNFLTGRNIEQAFFQNPKLVTHCAHCKQELKTPEHCDDLQQLQCSACSRALYQANAVVRVVAPPLEDDPYRGSANLRGLPQYEHLSYRLEVCVHCQSLLLQTALFEQILSLFSPEKNR